MAGPNIIGKGGAPMELAPGAQAGGGGMPPMPMGGGPAMSAPNLTPPGGMAMDSWQPKPYLPGGGGGSSIGENLSNKAPTPPEEKKATPPSGGGMLMFPGGHSVPLPPGVYPDPVGPPGAPSPWQLGGGGAGAGMMPPPGGAQPPSEPGGWQPKPYLPKW